MKQITFYGAFEDGLLLMSGHEFDMVGYTFVVHKGREPFDDEYQVSEKETGFSVPIAKTKNKQVAVETAKGVIASLSEQDLKERLAASAARRAGLKVITA